MDRNTVLGCLFVIFLGVALGCGGRKSIVVGAKNFTEQFVLGEIIAQQIEGCADLPVERRFNLGGTLLAHQAITSGNIDVYPEYTGTALTTVLKESASGPAEAVLESVREAYKQRFGVRWLDPLGFENTFAIAVPGTIAENRGLRTLSEAAASGIAWRLGVGYEFEQRPDGLPGLLEIYPLRISGTPRSMDLGLLYRAIQQGQVDMIAGNSTDAMITAMGLQVLDDDKGFFPPYQAAILVREETIAAYPESVRCLNLLSGSFTVETMRQINGRVDAGVPAEQVASEYLKAHAAR